MFVLPTGVRAGQVLELGNTFAMLAYLAPPVAADISTRIESPSTSQVFAMQANQFGYAYEPEHDFVVSEVGIYRVFLEASYAGETSAGILYMGISRVLNKRKPVCN